MNFKQMEIKMSKLYPVTGYKNVYILRHISTNLVINDTALPPNQQ